MDPSLGRDERTIFAYLSHYLISSQLSPFRLSSIRLNSVQPISNQLQIQTQNLMLCVTKLSHTIQMKRNLDPLVVGYKLQNRNVSASQSSVTPVLDGTQIWLSNDRKKLDLMWDLKLTLR